MRGVSEGAFFQFQDGKTLTKVSLVAAYAGLWGWLVLRLFVIVAILSVSGQRPRPHPDVFRIQLFRRWAVGQVIPSNGIFAFQLKICLRSAICLCPDVVFGSLLDSLV